MSAPWLLDPAVSLAAALAASCLFIATAVSKLRAPSAFAGQIAAFGLTPAGTWSALAYGIPSLQLVLAVGLVLPASRVPAAMGLAGLTLMFAAAVGINLLRGRRRIDCGCGLWGAAEQLHGWMLLRNLGLLVLLTLAALADPLTETARALTWIDAPTVLFAAAALSAIYVVGDLLLHNQSRLSPGAAGHAFERSSK